LKNETQKLIYHIFHFPFPIRLPVFIIIELPSPRCCLYSQKTYLTELLRILSPTALSSPKNFSRLEQKILLISSFYGFFSLPALRRLVLEGSCSLGCRAWLGFTTITDLLEDCFWFLRLVVYLSTWLFIIQLLCKIRLSFPSSLVSNPSKPSFFPYLGFAPYSFIFFSMLFTLFSFAIFGYPCPICLFESDACIWDLSMLILSWRRSLMRCYFFR
jgi:hypothetical protein